MESRERSGVFVMAGTTCQLEGGLKHGACGFDVMRRDLGGRNRNIFTVELRNSVVW